MKADFIINGRRESLEFDSRATLLEVLRNSGHREVKSGCENGECGVCTVLLDGIPVNSCMVLAASVIGREVTTIRGLTEDDDTGLSPVQEAFAEAGGIQCGFCTPAKVLVTYSLLSKNPQPSDEDIMNALDGNICRCTGYVKILDSVKLAAEKLKASGKESRKERGK